MSSPSQQKPPDSGDPSAGPWQRWSGMATVIGTVIGLLGLVVALAAWLKPQSSDGGSSSAATTSATTSGLSTGPTSLPTGVTTPPQPDGQVFLADGLFKPDDGGDRVVAVPRGITASHAVPIKCPTNQTSDQSSDVTFLLHGRYHQFQATVRPWYPSGTDQQSVTYVTALAGVAQKDGSLATTETGSQKQASMSAPLDIRATVDGAEKLTVRVQCENPDGTIILADARVSP